MHRFLSLCLCVLLLTSLGAVAQAQDTPSPTEENNETEGNEIENQLGDLVVRSSDYSGEEFTLVVEWTENTPERLTLTEMVTLEGSGSQGINIQSSRLLPGEQTEITIGAQKAGGTAALLLTTRQSLERGEGLIIQSGSPTERADVPFNLAALAVIGSALIGVGVSVTVVVRRKNAEDRGIERVA